MIMYEQTMTFISSLIPTRLETIVGGGVAFVGVLMQHLFGEFSETFETLLILMVIDYITGISAACINPNMKLDSGKCGTGALKKVVILLLISATYRIDLIGQTMAKDVVMLFFIGREGLSILENAANCGLPIPQKLKDTLAQFTEFKKNR
ncbi:MAG TPA: phage holin family protein [Candidatus Megamonas gallistercoris]|nr:phage holin family protein [Candidatus Megamonas gallistercoris]